jgi:hypothetical protein
MISTVGISRASPSARTRTMIERLEHDVVGGVAAGRLDEVDHEDAPGDRRTGPRPTIPFRCHRGARDARDDRLVVGGVHREPAREPDQVADRHTLAMLEPPGSADLARDLDDRVQASVDRADEQRVAVLQ